MANDSQSSDPISELRKHAEERLPSDKAVHELSAEEAQALVHELRVHQVELELQNEELREAQQELESVRNHLRKLYDFAPVGYLTVHSSGRILEANLVAARMLGLPRPALGARHLYRFVAEVDHGTFFAHRSALQETGKEQRCEVRMVREDGSPFEALLESVPALDPEGGTAYRTVMTDITATKEAERHLRQSDAIVEATGEGLVVIDPAWRIVRINRAFTEMTGFPADAVLGRDIEFVMAADYAGEVLDVLGARLREQGSWAGEIWCRRHDGVAFPAKVSFTTLHDAAGNLVQFAGLLRDATEAKRSEEQMRHRAYHDEVTGLANRSLFWEQLSHAARAARRHGETFALLLLDLDRFKQINDGLGHEAGDELLRGVASRLAACVRENDTVARIGGDEFAVVLRDIEQAHSVATVAGKILNALAEPIGAGGAEVVCAASIGIALYPVDADDLDTLRRYADIAMYRAKDSGRNSYHFFTASMTHSALEYARVERELGRALSENEFVLHYQPIVETESGQMIGAEALLRWQHPEQGLLCPDRFLSVSESTGQIHPLGDWVFREACRDSAGWGGDGPFVSINVSARQLLHADGLNGVVELLRETGLPPERVIIEIAESGTIDSEPAGLERLLALKRLGVRLAVDDFGTGYSALGYLTRFPFDILKIDGSFIHDVEASDEAARLVETIIAMAHGLRIKVVGEGVETQGQLDFLQRRGCDYVQGYLLGEPLPGAGFRERIQCGLA